MAKFKKIIFYDITASNYFGQKTFSEKPSSAISINLGEILNECSTGLMINDYYKTNHKFNDNIRTLLVDTIINYVITKKISMSVALANSIADQIADIFPTEVKVSIFIYYYIYSILLIFSNFLGFIFFKIWYKQKSKG